MEHKELVELYFQDLDRMIQRGQNHESKRVRNVHAWRHINRFAVEDPNNPEPYLNFKGDKRIFLWGDQHFGHKNIISFCDRPYPNTELMNECLVGNHNKVVEPNDTCIFMGDIAFLPDNKANQYLRRMNGYKILIVGNHDIHHDKLKNLEFDEIHVLYVIDMWDVNMVLTHYPMFNLPYPYINVHGHTHDKRVNCPQHINVACDDAMMKYHPILLNDVYDVAKTRLNSYEQFKWVPGQFDLF